LLVCFNRPLAERLKQVVQPGGMVDTFHGFCAKFLEAQGETIAYRQMFDDATFWVRIQDRVIGHAVPEVWRFQTLIVDEGQDFEPGWLELLRCFLTDDADILWLRDEWQNLCRRAPVGFKELVGYRCRSNYRTPASIAEGLRRLPPSRSSSATTCQGSAPG
jgi:superfamily I DNA/RNA helicase